MFAYRFWWTPYLLAIITALPSYITIIIVLRAGKLATKAVDKLDVVHDLVNSQSEKLNVAIEGKAAAVGELKGRADAVAEQQASVAVATPQSPLPISIMIVPVEEKK